MIVTQKERDSEAENPGVEKQVDQLMKYFQLSPLPEQVLYT